ncbi:MAG: multiheme c-type cytochrome [Polyangiales bacterium]
MGGRLSWLVAVLVGLSGCQVDGDAPLRREASEREATELAQTAPAPRSGLGLPPMTREELMDPETCGSCHPTHFREWEMSMHAYAANDPVFIAMNKRGQRETNGALGDFCVNCHAPMAVREGLTKDGLNLAELPQKMKGVTCYFCHNAVEVGPDHFNNPIKLANDTIMRGPIRDPVNPGVHGVAYDEAFNDNSLKSNVMCGSCHDIVNAKGAHIERTFKEYKESFFNRPRDQSGDTCAGCHMPVRENAFVTIIPNEQLPKRNLHVHSWPGVDVALSDWPHDEEFRRLTDCVLSMSVTVYAVRSDGRGGFTVMLETQAGHKQPSGASADRRMWLEFVAYNAQNQVVFKTGVIADGEREEYPPGDPKHDPRLFMLRDRWKDDAGEETHMFWEVAPNGISDLSLPPMSVPGVPHYLERTFQIPTRQQPARVEMRVKMRPVGIDVLEDLVASGDLDPAVIDRMPTFTLKATELVWTPAMGLDWKPKMRRPAYCFKDDVPIDPATGAPAAP